MSPHNQSQSISPGVLYALILWCGFHVLFPLRHLLSEHDVLWSEEGMRYSWRVMVREKMGSIIYLVERADTGRTWEVSPSRYLEPRQLSEMSGQPRMIKQLAFYIRQDFETRLKTEVKVRVRALVSLNGRAPNLLINPAVDLTRMDDSTVWLQPRPVTPPLSVWPNK